MAATVMNFEDFYSYVESQVSRITRYNQDIDPENFTIVFVKSEQEHIGQLNSFLETNLRKSDVVFQKDNYVFLCLASTDKVGALHVDEMIKEFFPTPPIVAFVSYDEDGKTKEDLFANLTKICDDEYALDLEDYLK